METCENYTIHSSTCEKFKSVVTKQPYLPPSSSSDSQKRVRPPVWNAEEVAIGDKVVNDSVIHLRHFILDILKVMSIVIQRAQLSGLSFDYFALKLEECFLYISDIGKVFDERDTHHIPGPQHSFLEVVTLITSIFEVLPISFQMSLWNALYVRVIHNTLLLPNLYLLITHCLQYPKTRVALLCHLMEYTTAMIESPLDKDKERLAYFLESQDNATPVAQKLLADILQYVDIPEYSYLFSRFLNVCHCL